MKDKKWTRFMDMHSGGGLKEKPYHFIYIEAPETEAKVIFYNRFGHSPDRVSCTCCGEDYSVSSEESIEQASAHERNCQYAWFRPDGSECPQEEAWFPGKGFEDGYSARYVERKGRWGAHVPIDEYLKHEDVLVIRANEIKDEERVGEVPEQGYVWRD